MNDDKSGAAMQVTGPGDISSKHTGSKGASLNEIESAFRPEVKLIALSDCIVVRFGLALRALPLQWPLGSPAGATEANVAAVGCGGEQGLMGLTFFREESLTEFLAKNAVLSGILVTRYQQTFVAWLKPINRLPPNGTSEEGAIISDGLVPVYAPAGAPWCCSLYQYGSPVDVDLHELIFPGRLRDLFDSWVLREKFGSPFIGGRGRLKPNTKYWANLIMKMLDLRLNQVAGLFLVRDSQTQEESTLEASKLFRLVAGVLQQASEQQAIIRESSVAKIVKELKKLCIAKFVLTDLAMQFARNHLERRAGAILQKNEAAARLRDFLKTRGLAPPETQLRKALKEAVFVAFLCHESHSSGRVFRGLALRPAASEPDAINGEPPSPGHPQPKGG